MKKDKLCHETYEMFNFDVCYTQYHKQILNYCLYSTRSYTLAEELAQDIFLKLYLAKDNINLEQGVKGYLLAIAKNTVLEWFRKLNSDRKRKENYMNQYLSEGLFNQAEQQIYSRIDLSILKAYIENHPENRRRAFELVRLEDKTYEEAAKELSISSDTVKYHLKKADKIIRKGILLYQQPIKLISFIYILFK